MEIVVQYSCYQDEHLISANLEHLYGFADRIVISYGAFRGIREIRVLWGLPESDSTLEIIKAFPDPDEKITLIEAPDGEWVDFTESRRAALAACSTSGFLMTQDTDEFWAVGALDRIRKTVSARLEHGAVAIDCSRIWFLRGVESCLWPQVGEPYVIPYRELVKSEFLKTKILNPTLRGGRKILRTVFRKPRWSKARELVRRVKPDSPWTTFNYANGVGYFPSPAKHIQKVAGFFLKPGLFWTTNQIDSRLIDPESGDSWHRHSRTIFEPSILCFHVSYCDPVISRVKQTYYRTVFGGVSPEQAYSEVSKVPEPQADMEFDGYMARPLPTRLKKVLPRELLKVAQAKQ